MSERSPDKNQGNVYACERGIPQDRNRHTLDTLLLGTAICTGTLLVRFICAITFFFFSLAAYCFVVSVARLHEAPIAKRT